MYFNKQESYKEKIQPWQASLTVYINGFLKVHSLIQFQFQGISGDVGVNV